MSSGWSIFVIVLVIINMVGCGWLIWWTMNMRTDDQDEGDESTGHVWDVDLKENNNPLPKWWLNTFYLTIIFTIVYLVLYPGFGNFAGHPRLVADRVSTMPKLPPATRNSARSMRSLTHRRRRAGRQRAGRGAG